MENTVENAKEFLRQRENYVFFDTEEKRLVAYASQVKPEIKLPEKRILNADTPEQYHTMYLAWNNCIEEIKRLNNITQ